MKNNYKIYGLLVLFFVIYFSGCATTPITTTTIGSIGARDRVLIATQSSEFKDTVVSNVVEDLKGNDIYIEVTDISNLTDKSINEYKAIVIINSYQLFMFNRHVKKFLENINDYEQEKVVLLATAGSPHKMNKGKEVDAISSASKINEADIVSADIVQRVNTILAR